MQRVDCTEYPVIGWLIHHTLNLQQRIPRTPMAVTKAGSINLYFYDNTYILECDANGDHIPNDYHFFKTAERSDIAPVIEKMATMLGLTDPTHIGRIVDMTLTHLQTACDTKLE